MRNYGPAKQKHRTRVATNVEDSSYRLASIERYLARLTSSPLWRRTSLSSFVAAGLIFVQLLHTFTIRESVDVEPLVVETHTLGDPTRALERIRHEHYVSIAELDELANDPSLDRYERMVMAHAPLILDDYPTPMLDVYDDIPIGVYYVYSVSTLGSTELVHIEYWMYFSDENIGMPSRDRMARWGHPLDREIIYRLNILNERVYNAEYQAPIHQLTPFTFPEESRPIFRIASRNHNFQLVQPERLEVIETPHRLLAPLPQDDWLSSPMRDPDFLALAATEALLQHRVDMSQYVYVGIESPAYVLRDPYHGVVDIGVLVGGRWFHLHESIRRGVIVWGFRLVAIDLGYTPLPEDIKAVRLGINTRQVADAPSLRVVQVFVYPILETQT